MKKYILLFAVFLLVSTPMALAAVSLIDDFPTISDVKVGPEPTTQPAPTTQPVWKSHQHCVDSCMDGGGDFTSCMDTCEDFLMPRAPTN